MPHDSAFVPDLHEPMRRLLIHIKNYHFDNPAYPREQYLRIVYDAISFVPPKVADLMLEELEGQQRHYKPTVEELRGMAFAALAVRKRLIQLGMQINYLRPEPPHPHRRKDDGGKRRRRVRL